MKANIRWMFSLCMVFTLCITLALSVSATTDTRSAGIYGNVVGECSLSDTVSYYFLNTVTRVTRNPDGAFLKTEAEYYYEDGLLFGEGFLSDSGARTFTKNIELRPAIDFTPDVIYVNHRVMSADNPEDDLYAAFTYTDVDWDHMGDYQQ